MPKLDQKFRDSEDYKLRDVKRDLVDYVQAVEKKLAELEARLVAGGL